jgi:hypothetical protein
MRKGLFCFYGGSFRDKSEYVYGVLDKNVCFYGQSLAVQSQINFLKYISNQRGEEIKIQVIIITYQTEFSHFFETWFSDFDPLVIIIQRPIGNFRLLNKICQIISRYESDFYFLCRIDLVFKSSSIELITFPQDKVMCVSVCSVGSNYHFVSNLPNHVKHLQGNILPEEETRSRPNDTILYIPSKFLSEMIETKIRPHHDFTLSVDYDVYKNVGYYLNTFHDSNSWGDRNPLYFICNRLETLLWQSEFFYHAGEGHPEVDFNKSFQEVFKDERLLI